MKKKFKKINIEISNICNLQCTFCPEVVREKKIMGVELFTKIIGEVAPLTDEVCFHLMGEPLAHSKFGEFIAICSRAGVKVNLTSNGILLNEAKRELLLDPIVSQVNFSVHSFESNFGNKDIGPYLEKLFLFTEAAFERRPDLYINYRMWNLADPLTQSEKNLEIIEKIEARFGFKLMDRPSGAEDPNRLKNGGLRKSRKVKNRLYLHFDTRFDWPHLKSPVRGTAGFCHGLSNHFGIHADGTVVPCCLDKEAAMPLGNSEFNTIPEILNSPRALAIAKGFRNHRLVEELCQKCTFISRFDGKLKKCPPQANSGRSALKSLLLG